MSSGYLKSSWNGSGLDFELFNFSDFWENGSGLDLELFNFLDFLDFFIFEDAAPTGPNAARKASNEMAMVNIA